jgi:hypothetical protein
MVDFDGWPGLVAKAIVEHFVDARRGRLASPPRTWQLGACISGRGDRLLIAGVVRNDVGVVRSWYVPLGCCVPIREE